MRPLAEDAAVGRDLPRGNTAGLISSTFSIPRRTLDCAFSGIGVGLGFANSQLLVHRWSRLWYRGPARTRAAVRKVAIFGGIIFWGGWGRRRCRADARSMNRSRCPLWPNSAKSVRFNGTIEGFPTLPGFGISGVREVCSCHATHQFP